jgi:hypothetical protein
MKRLLIALVLAATVHPANGGAGKVRYPFVSPLQIIDATHFQRRNAAEIEVFILSRTSGGLLTFYLNGQPVAKLSGGEAIRLYLSPGRYRFGVIPFSHVVLSSMWEMNADVKRNAPRFYRIFQSSGFTSSGGNAVYEIAPLKNAEAQ